MKKVLFAGGLSLMFLAVCAFTVMSEKKLKSYRVYRQISPVTIDANWDKSVWKKVKAVPIDNFTGQLPAFLPTAEVKMSYDSENLYLIYRVNDKHVRLTTRDFNGPVSGDACVEFFFSPDMNYPERYFNLEINANGAPLMAYHVDGRKNYTMLDPVDLKKLEIAHTLPDTILEKEIDESVKWVVECRIPLSLIQKFTEITVPEKNAQWRANFYKTSSKSSNPHWITWSVVDTPVPDFHRPEFFGNIIFK